MTKNRNPSGAESSKCSQLHSKSAADSDSQAIDFDQYFAERLIETAHVIISVLDVSGRVIRFNHYMEEITGYHLDEVRGRDWSSTFLPVHERKGTKVLFARCVNGESVGAFTSTIVSKSGVVRAIDWRWSALRNSSHKVVGVLSIGKDITQRLEAERELHELNKVAQQRERLADVGAIAAQIVHDVGNPLAALSMQAQLIRRRAREHPDQPVSTVFKSAEQMVLELRRLDSLIREFMNFARVQRLLVRPIELQRFLDNVVALWHPVAFVRRINLTADGPDRRLTLCADEEKLRRVLDNLVKNAVEAIGEGPGHITISVSTRPSGRVMISVADSGPGIPKGIEVFRLFESTKADGSGLGLAVARQIVLAHGGAIRFEAVRPHGTVFHVELPLEGPGASAATPPPPALRSL
jgi:PAS domain S-box-containing protein